MNNAPLLEVKDLKQYFNISMGAFKTNPLKAVDGFSFKINFLLSFVEYDGIIFSGEFFIIEYNLCNDNCGSWID